MTTPSIEFVGHAGVVVEAGGARVWTDPWLISDCFNDGWRLHPEPVGPDLDTITHIWISHEHPDHLNIPTLRSLPIEFRRRTPVLFQEHYSEEVSGFLHKLEFPVIEMRHGRARGLTDRLSVECHQVGHEDAAMVFETPEMTILNLNDCKPTARGLDRIVAGRRITLLLDQFSIAGWNGNPDDQATKDAHAADAMEQFTSHVEQIQPEYVIPFASFVRFSHAESAHLNLGLNTIDDVAERVPPPRLTVMYPGDRWTIDAPFAGTAAAMDRYRADAIAIPDLPLTTHDPVPVADVLAAAESTVASVREAFHRPVLARVPALTFHLTDHDAYVRVSFTEGATLVDGPVTDCTVHLSSQAAHYTFSHRWAVPTLLISGRFTLSGDQSHFDRFKQLAAAYASGYHSRGLVGGLTEARHRHFFMNRVPDIVDTFLPKARAALRRN